MWKLTPVCPAVTDGTYAIKNLNSGRFISESNGNVIQGAEEAWTFTKQSDGMYTVQSADGRALTVEKGSADDGANISLEKFIGDESQKFTLYCNSDGSYAILSAASGGKSCVDVYGISLDDGANICQWNYWGGNGQKFILEPVAVPSKNVIGDVNADGQFTIADIIMMQKYLLGAGTLIDPNAGDLCEDGRLNIFDLSAMKNLIME